MTIANSTVHNTGTTQSTASVSNSAYKTLQNQLTAKQNRLDKLSSDTKLNDEEKAKEQQKIKQQIAELNRKLRQMQLEQQNKEKEADKRIRQERQKIDSKETLSDKTEKEEIKQELLSENTDNHADLEKENRTDVIAQKILSSNFEMQQELLQNGIYKQNEREISQLETEIEADKRLGSDTTKKEEQLTELKEKENIITEIKDVQAAEYDPFTMNPNVKIIIREN